MESSSLPLPLPELPQECWEIILNFLPHHRYLEPLSLVSTRFLSLTNFLRTSLTISSPSSLPLLLHRFPNLSHLKIHIPCQVYSFCLDSILTQIANSSIDLESLDISNQGDFPFKGMIQLGIKKKTLRKLDCSFIRSLQDDHLFVIGSYFPLLEELNIGYPHYVSRFDPNGSLDFRRSSGLVTDTGVIELATKLKELRKIDVSGNHFISDKSLLALCSNCPLLSELVVRDCDFISQAGIGLALRSCVGLSSISVDAIGIPTVDLILQDSFGCARNLCEIDLSYSFISDEWMCLVAEARLPLRKLSIFRCYNFSVDGLYSLLRSYQELVYLNLEGANFLTDDCVIELAKFVSKLACIDLSLCCKLTGLTIFTLVRNCPLLMDIRMNGTNIGAEDCGTDFVVSNSKVESLSLAGNNNLSDDCIKNIVTWFPNLYMLNISGCPAVSENGVKEVLRNCGKIQHFQINQCVGINNLTLDFDVPKLEVLQAQGPMMDDEALGMISKRCCGLLYLDLEGCLYVTMEGLKQVAQNCGRLREVNLRYCNNVKAEGVVPMVLARPSLRKIILSEGSMPNDSQRNFLLRHGCLVCES